MPRQNDQCDISPQCFVRFKASLATPELAAEGDSTKARKGDNGCGKGENTYYPAHCETPDNLMINLLRDICA